MSILEIPKSQKGPLGDLLSLTPAKRNALLDGLEAAGPTLVAGKTALVEAAGFAVDDAADVLYMLLGLYQANRRDILNPSLLVEALEADSELQPKVDNEELIGFFERLFTLEASLGILSKAYRLAREHSNRYCVADIVSDLRPVFDEVENQPVAATIVHTLRLAYHTGAGIDLEELFVGLGAGDLRRLAAAIDRALEKDRSLSSFAEKSELPLLTPEDE